MERRKYIRFNPELLEVAIIAFESNKHKDYDDTTIQMEGDMAALIIDESYSGCNLLIFNRKKDPSLFSVGSSCVVKAGVLSPLKATVRWREEVTPEILKAGLEFED